MSVKPVGRFHYRPRRIEQFVAGVREAELERIAIKERGAPLKDWRLNPAEDNASRVEFRLRRSEAVDLPSCAVGELDPRNVGARRQSPHLADPLREGPRLRVRFAERAIQVVHEFLTADQNYAEVSHKRSRLSTPIETLDGYWPSAKQSPACEAHPAVRHPRPTFLTVSRTTAEILAGRTAGGERRRAAAAEPLSRTVETTPLDLWTCGPTMPEHAYVQVREFHDHPTHPPTH